MQETQESMDLVKRGGSRGRNAPDHYQEKRQHEGNLKHTQVLCEGGIVPDTQ